MQYTNLHNKDCPIVRTIQTIRYKNELPKPFILRDGIRLFISDLASKMLIQQGLKSKN